MFIVLIYPVSQKTGHCTLATVLLLLQDKLLIHRFSKFFHWQTQQWLPYLKLVTTLPCETLSVQKIVLISTLTNTSCSFSIDLVIYGAIPQYQFWSTLDAVISACCVYPFIIRCLHSESAMISEIAVSLMNFQTCGRRTAEPWPRCNWLQNQGHNLAKNPEYKSAGCEGYVAASDWCMSWSGRQDIIDYRRLHSATGGYYEYSSWQIWV